MKQLRLLSLLAAVVFAATNLWADPQNIGTASTGLQWEMTGTTLTITYNGSGTGVIPDYTLESKIPWKDNRADITAISLPDGLITIGRNAFKGCINASFTSVTIPSSVTTIGQGAFEGCSSLESVTIPSSVTSIGNYAFRSCSSLTSIAIPSSVTSIGGQAFKSCSSLASVTFSAATPCTMGSSVFDGTSASLKIYVPDANAQAYSNAWVADYYEKLYCATSGAHAPEPHGEGDFGASGDNLHWEFNYSGYTLTITGSGSTGELDFMELPWKDFSSFIKTVYLPAGITHISEDAFFNVKADEVYINADPAGLTWDDGLTFGTGDDFKDDKATLCYVPAEYFAAYNAKFSAVNVTFTLAPWTSGACEVTIGGSTITVSGSGAMADYANAAAQPWAAVLSGVTTIVIEDGVTHIGNYAFDGCSNVTSIQTKSATPPTLGTNAFNGHAAEVEISKYPCINYASYVSAWSTFDESCFSADCVAPANSCGSGVVWDVTDNVLSITRTAYPGTGAMNNYTSLSLPWKASVSSITSVVIGDGVTTIGNYAFSGCNNASLTSITIPEGVTSIGTSAFSSTKITEITIPASITSVGNYAFSNCYSLTTVNMLPTTAPTAGGTSIFFYSSAVTAINYPCGSSASYEAAWSDYSALLHENDCPVEDAITANENPEEPGVYYSTYFSNKAMALPDNGTEAYVATLSVDEMLLTKIAEGAQVLPANTPVILRSPSSSFDMTESVLTPVSFAATNNLHGSMSVTATVNNASQQYYVLSGHSSDYEVHGVGFYKFDGDIPAQKAYIIITSGGIAAAPKRVRFVFEEEQHATGLDQVSSSQVQSTKVLRDGQLIIIRGDKEYNAQGQIIK